MNDLINQILTHIMDMKSDIGEMKEDLRQHKEGVIQNRARIEYLERQEEELKDDVEDLKRPSDAETTLKTLKTWGQGLIVLSAAGKILYDIFS